MRVNHVLLLVSTILGSSMSAKSIADSAIDANIKCPALVQAATKKATAQRAIGSAAAEQVTSGEKLKNKTCLDDIEGFDFNFFSSIPTLTGEALRRAKEEAMKQLRSLACEAGNEAIKAGNKLLTCNAALGLSIDGSAGFESINVEECGGLDLEADIDAGSHNAGNGNQAGGSIDGDVSGSNRSGTNSGGSDTSWSNWFNQ